MENIIFGILVLIVVGAGVFTCIYEVGESFNAREESNTEQIDKKNE
ncbi:MAG: hypothetical protein K2N95_05675 [Lachnospiraceae bacterium]|nr:hypothetical protein [Lachnospiraceae bacterium]